MDERPIDTPDTTEQASVNAQAEQPAPQAQAPWYRRRNPLIAAAAVIITAGIGLGVALSGSSSVTVHGSVDMGLLTYLDEAPGADGANPSPGDPCSASSGYNIAVGATVTIGGANGQPIAVAALTGGKVNAAGYCEFDFTASVPDQSAYTATLGQHGTTTWTKAQATSAAGMTLSLSYSAG